MEHQGPRLAVAALGLRLGLPTSWAMSGQRARGGSAPQVKGQVNGWMRGKIVDAL